ncbi:MAG: tRNA (adenosine(37)-N6)-dimethylallyltransferase MiaA [Clostridia bacterium]|nr:tRNA (adenosine(37)-N6)-dimethylallyltransferase MiaA [Clostridia bacterium]
MEKQNKQKLIIITGPTSVGKTALGVCLAKKIDGEVISADSIQVYRGFDIGSAKVTSEEMQGVPHHLIDIKDPSEEYSAGDFAEHAKMKIEEINDKGKIPIVVGGTGLYISALLFPFDSDCTRDDEFRLKLEKIAEKDGSAKLHEMLEEIDPESAKAIHPNQTVRIVRALEIFKLTGKKKSELERKTNQSVFDYLLIVLSRDRKEVYEGIEKRVEQMIKSGLVEEVKGLLSSGVSPNAPAMKGIGYKEILPHVLDGEPLETCVDLLKQHTRNYAKRQLTYFKKMDKAVFVEYNDVEKIQKKVKDFLRR